MVLEVAVVELGPAGSAERAEEGVDGRSEIAAFGAGEVTVQARAKLFDGAFGDNRCGLAGARRNLHVVRDGNNAVGDKRPENPPCLPPALVGHGRELTHGVADNGIKVPEYLCAVH